MQFSPNKWIFYIATTILIVKLTRAVDISMTTRPCQRVTEALPVLLTSGDEIFHRRPGDLIRAARSLVTLDLFNSTERERIVCAFEGLDTLSELLTASTVMDVAYNAVKIAYDYAAFQFVFAKYLMREDNAYQFDGRAVRPEIAELVRNLEAFDLTRLDPTGVEAMSDIEAPHADFSDSEILVTSHLSPEKQCRKLTHNIKKVWRLMVKTNSLHDRDVGKEYRAILRQWTGLHLDTHGEILQLVCDFMGLAKSEGLYGIYTWILDHGVLNSTLKAAYPLLLESIQDLRKTAEYSINMLAAVQYSRPVLYSETALEGSGEGESKDQLVEQQVDSMQQYNSLLLILENLEQMGLLSLDDDLSV